MSVSVSVKKLFDEYEKAFGALDFKRIGEFFADSFLSAGPRGTIASSRAEYLQLSEKASAVLP